MKWETLKLGELCRIELGKTPARSNKKFWDKNKTSDNVWLSIADLPLSIKPVMLDSKEYISDEGAALCKIVPQNTLIVSFKLSLGRLAIAGRDLYTNEAIAALYIGEDVQLEQDYLYWYLTFFDWDSAAGSDIKVKGKTLNKAKLKEIKILLPPIPEQKRIVALLDTVFADLDQTRTKTEQNLKNARELFDSYLQQVFSQKGKNVQYKKIEDLTSLITKGSSPKWQGINYVEEPGVLFVTSENVGVNKMLFKKIKYVEEAFNEKDSKSILVKGDVLTNIVGASIGRTAIFDQEQVANINQAVCLMRCDSGGLFNEYLSYLLNSPYLVKILHENEINNARANLSLGFFRKLEIPVPSIERQKEVVKNIKVMHLKTEQLEIIYNNKLNAVDELKKSILQKAFSGELTASSE